MSNSVENPIPRFLQDWAKAQLAEDPSANHATVASVDSAGEPHTRTMILRQVGDQLAIFFNQTSPKWEQFANSRTIALLLFWPSQQCQYRLRCTHEYMPTDQVHDSWSLRADTAQRLDWLYTVQQPQSSSIGNSEDLYKSLARLPLRPPITAPATAIGYFLMPETIERLELNTGNQPHDRQLYEYDGSGWSCAQLVP